MKRIITLVLSYTVVCTSLFAQQEDPVENNILEKKIENIAENTDADIDYSEFVDQLQQYAKNPLDINKAAKEDLEGLLILTSVQINQLLQHRVKYGELVSIYELQAVEGWDMDLIYFITPYITVNKSENELNLRYFSDFWKNSNHFIATGVFNETLNFLKS